VTKPIIIPLAAIGVDGEGYIRLGLDDMDEEERNELLQKCRDYVVANKNEPTDPMNPLFSESERRALLGMKDHK